MGVPDAFVLMQSGLALGAVGAGFLGVFCSIMVYAVTRRPLWSFPQTFTRFGLTLLILGSAYEFVGMGSKEGRKSNHPETQAQKPLSM